MQANPLDAPEITALRTPPHSIEAEQSVLGGIFIDKNCLYSCSQIKPEDFYRKNHELIFKAILTLDESNKPFDVVTVAERLESEKKLDEVGGLAYLAALAENTPSAHNVKAYADIVQKRSVLRQLLLATTEIGDRVFNPEGMSIDEIRDFADETITKITTKDNSGGINHISKTSAAVLNNIEKRATMKGITGISFGLKDLDRRTNGLQPADLVVVGGRPSMGKTAFAMNIANRAAVNHQVTVFSLEMPEEALHERSLSMIGDIDYKYIRNGEIAKTEEGCALLNKATKTINRLNLYIDDTPALTAFQIRARARNQKRRHGLDLIVIDYLQLMSSASRSENKAQEIGETTRLLKALAKELNVPIILLSQLNRELEKRPNKRPIMADLRESGAIEQDADLIIFPYRDEVYNDDSPDKGTAEIIFAKFRNGQVGTDKVCFQGDRQRFTNYAPYGG